MIYVYAAAYVPVSNGIRVNYTLVELLNKIGIDARLVSYEKRRYDYQIPKPIEKYVLYLDENDVNPSRDDIIVYPETIYDNPLNAARIVRYLLNRPGVLTGGLIEYRETDYLVAYSKSVDRSLPQLFIMNDDRKEILESRTDVKQNSVCLYFGKVNRRLLREKVNAIRSIIKKFKKIEVITRLNPTSRKELFDKIAGAQLLVSFDPLTNLSYESTLLGTPVLLADTSLYAWNGFNIPLWGMYTSYGDLALHEEEVSKAFAEYERHLENRESMIRAWVNDVFRHFEILESHDHVYTRERREIIEGLSAMDRSCLNGARGYQRLDNINFAIELGMKILFTLYGNRMWLILIKKIDYLELLRAIIKKIGIYETLRWVRRRLSRSKHT